MEPNHFATFRRPWLGAVLALALAAEARALGQAPGATNDASNLSVDALVDDALANNPERIFYESEIAAAQAERRNAGQLAHPELEASVGQKMVRGGGLRAEGVAWSVSMMQPFEWPGRLGLRKAIANRDVELAELGYERFKMALAGRVRSLAYGLFAAEEKARSAREVARRFKTLRETLVQRDPAGLTPLLETRVVEATELNAHRKASAAQLAVEAALLELNQLRGQPPDAPLSIRPPQIAFRPLEDTAALLELARTNNFEVRLRAVELAQQGFKLSLARNERFPAISAGPSFSEERAGGERERVIGLGFSLPLPLWNRNRAEIDAAAARRTQAELSLLLVERDMQRKLMQAALAYNTKLDQMAQWRPDAQEHFQEAAELADRHYRLGAVPLPIYVELQKQYLDAVEALLDTKEEALVAANELELLAGLTLPLTSMTPGERNK